MGEDHAGGSRASHDRDEEIRQGEERLRWRRYRARRLWALGRERDGEKGKELGCRLERERFQGERGFSFKSLSILFSNFFVNWFKIIQTNLNF
jgi:hypothetical protein